VTTRLREAVEELDRTDPGWRLQDIEAAREKVPDEQNGPRVVAAAWRLLPRDWPPPELEATFDQLEPPEPLTPGQFARLSAELEGVRPALEEARKLATRPTGRHQVTYARNILNTLLRDEYEGRRVTRLLRLDALRHAQAGDLKSALR